MIYQTAKKIFRRKLSGRQIFYSILILLLTGLITMPFFADKIIFPGRRSYRDDSQLLKIQTPDGLLLSAIYLPSPQSGFTILYCHGNGEDLGDLRPILQWYPAHGFSILAYDYRGYGTSQGTISEASAYRDVETVYDYLRGELNTPPDHILALGRSVGGGSAAHLASRREVAGLIFESAFVSAFRVLTRFPLLPGDQFKNIDKLKNIHCPVLVLHGTRDWLIPCWHGRKLFQTAHEPKLCLWVEGAGHNDLLFVADRAYWQKLGEFTRLIQNNRHQQNNE